MKKLINFWMGCLLVMSVHINVKAQTTYTDDSTVLKKIIYKVSIITTDSKKNTGYLVSLSDSNLYLSPTPTPLQVSLVKTNDNLSSYPYDRLEKIEIKRKGAAHRGAWQGALIGLAGGAIAGFISGDDPVAPTYNYDANNPLGSTLANLFSTVSNAFRMTAGEKALIYGIIGATTGAVIGSLVGSLVKRKFIIGRSKQKFNVMRQNIIEKLYLH